MTRATIQENLTVLGNQTFISSRKPDDAAKEMDSGLLTGVFVVICGG